MVDRCCPFCVPLAIGHIPETFSHVDAKIHQDGIRTVVMGYLRDEQVDGPIEHLRHAELGTDA